MQIEVTTDRNVEGGDDLIDEVRTQVDSALERFSAQITRVEVHLGDENADKSGAADKRCTVEARLAGQQPVAVTDHASSLDAACRGALRKLTNLLGTKLGRQNNRKGGATIREAEER
jgi:ribosome-associated translation inhibitor RaiA